MKKLFYIFLSFQVTLLTLNVLCQTPTQQWASRFISPSGMSSGIRDYMALDKIGDCFIAGEFLTASNDVVLVKYNSTGVQQWYRTYQGAGNRVDLPYGVIADSIGNSYITLSSGLNFGPYDIITIKYDPQGVQQWIKTYDSGGNDEPRDLIMDVTGNIYVGGISGDESIIIKYTPSGDSSWVRKYLQPGFRFPAKSIALDNQNNVCLFGGRITISNGVQEYYTLKYDSNGVFQWIQATAFNTISAPVKIKTELNENVIVTGSSLGGKIVTIKYNNLGTFQWQKEYDGPGSGGDVPYDMDIDKQSNIIITGRSSGIATGSYDYITIKYNIIGDSLWVKRYNGTGNANDESYSLDLDDSNNAYTTGRSIGSFSTWDYVTIKYNFSGVQQWLIRYPNISNSGGIAYNVLLDKNRNVYVTGISDSSSISGYVTIKYSQPVGIIHSNEIASQYSLEQNYPNPFNPLTNIKYQISKSSFVKLIVYDILGNEISTLVNKKQNAGFYEATFNAEKISSGIYFYKLITENYTETKKMILVK